jgi:AraC-like DNA-binding protein
MQNELEILNKIRYNKLNGKTQEIFLQARINDLLVSYFMAHEATEIQTSQETDLEYRIHDSASYINYNLHLPLSIADLSKRAGLNLDKFEKTFKQILGCSPQKFIEDTRMQEGARILRTTELPIADVAYKVGYADQSYFTKVFKRAFGISPRNYRAQDK